jgi:hypothetical protein
MTNMPSNVAKGGVMQRREFPRELRQSNCNLHEPFSQGHPVQRLSPLLISSRHFRAILSERELFIDARYGAENVRFLYITPCQLY